MNNLKLNKLNHISEEMKNAAVGGESQDYCSCGCCWVNNGGAAFAENASANFAYCLKSQCDDAVKIYEM